MRSFLPYSLSRPLCLIAVCLGALTPNLALGKTLLRSPETTNLSEDEAKGMAQIFRAAYTEHSGHEVVLAPAPPAPPELTSPPAAATPVAPMAPPVTQPPGAPSEPAPADAASPQGAAISPPAASTHPAPDASATPAPADEQRIFEANQKAQRDYERAYAKYQSDLVADEYLELVFVRLENRIQVRASKYSPSGEQIHSVRTMLSKMDEAPEVLDRLALALAKDLSYEETATISNLTSEESGTPIRKHTENIAGVKTGFVFPYSPRQAFDGYVSFGFDVRLESSNYFIEFGGGFGMPYFVSDTYEDPGRWRSGGLYSEISFNGYLTQTDISPYIGMGVSPRLWFTNDGGGMNLLPFAQAGVMFLRSSETRFYSEFRTGYSVTSLGYSESGREIRPIEFGFNLGVGW